MPARKVLVVDDDAPTRSLLQAVLEHTGYACIPCGDGREALELIRGGDYDVLILDLLLPDVDGFEILRRMKKSWSALLPRTIVLTAAAERIYDGRNELDGVWKILRKPVDIGQLGEHIADCAEQRERDGEPMARVSPRSRSQQRTG